MELARAEFGKILRYFMRRTFYRRGDPANKPLGRFAVLMRADGIGALLRNSGERAALDQVGTELELGNLGRLQGEDASCRRG